MKRCATCGSQYKDETLSFCLSDGSPLRDDGPVTAVLSDAETVVRPSYGNAPNERQVIGVSSLPQPPAQPAESRTEIAVLLTAAGMLVLFGFIVLIAVLIWTNSE